MANLTQNLAILQKGKEDIIDEINSKLKESDQEALPIDCEWNDINNLLDKVNVKKDRSAEVDTNEIYSDICSGELNKEIVTGVTTITEYSMYGQKYLPKVTANNCTSIGDHAFYDCQALTEASFPNVITIPTYCFYNNKSLKNITVSNVENINSYAFNNCIELENISIPKVTSIGDHAFYNCSKLKTIELNDEATYNISEYAFTNCNALESNLAQNAKTISQYGINNTGVLELDGPQVTSLSTYSISYNNNLERISLENIKTIQSSYTIAYNPKLISLNLAGLTRFGNENAYSYAVISDNKKLESIYVPSLRYLCGGRIVNCNSLTSFSAPNATEDDYPYPHNQGWNYDVKGLFIQSCANIESIDLGKLKQVVTRTAWTTDNGALISNCPKLQLLNLSSLEYCYPAATFNSSYYNYYYECKLVYRAGLQTLSLPNFKYLNSYIGYIANDCRNLTNINLNNLEYVGSYDYTGYTSGNNIIYGCPKLTKIELPNLTKIQSNRVFAGYRNDATLSSKKYIETMMQAIKETYPDTYESNSEYITWYERRYGGTIDGTLSKAAPYNAGKYSGIDYNMQWCGLKSIKLPKLTHWEHRTSSGSNYRTYNGIFNYVTELEELILGDGTFTPNTPSLSYTFVNYAPALKKVVLNYPVVLTANTAITNIFYNCGHLNGARYSFTYNGRTYYYENEEGLSDLYFYVPDNLVDSYKAATNWSTYASQIRPISELADLNIDSSITSIANAEYKNNQTLTSVAGYGITSVGEEGFRSSSASSIEFANCTEVNKYAFANCPNLERVQLKYTQITNITEGVFMNSLVSFCSLPLVTTIEANAFKNTQVSTISAPVLEKIGNSAFENDLITSLSLPVVNTLGKASFKNNSISSITLPEVITINDNTFERNNLTEISIPKVTFIGNSAFKSNSITSATLPEVTTLGKYAFAENDVQEISIPKVIMIDDYAFANNTNLESINLGTVRILGNNIFDGCTSLANIILEGYAVPTGTLPEGINLHVRESLVEAFEEAYPNNTVIGDVE